MIIWLVTIGEPLPIDSGGRDRLYRAGTLASVLSTHGHTVVWWTSSFDHVRKCQRCDRDMDVRIEDGTVIKLLHGCGYSRNVSIRRVLDHRIHARKFAQQAETEPVPDVILCSLPTLELSLAATKYGKRHQVPVILDVRDLWPDVFLELLPRWTRSIGKLALFPLWWQARRACQNAYAICGNSPGFVTWGTSHAGRVATELDRAFPFGYVKPLLSSQEREEAQGFWQKLGIGHNENVFTVCFFGTLGRQFDLETVIDAALMLHGSGIAVRFVLCGVGENMEMLQDRAGGCPAVIFPGWVGRAQIWTLMEYADVGIAPYQNHSGFIDNLPNKPIEYMSCGLPVVSGLNGYLEEVLKRGDCGVTYQPGDAQSLRDTILDLTRNDERVLEMSKKAIDLFNREYSAEQVYAEMTNYLELVRAGYSSDPRRLSPAGHGGAQTL